MSTFNRGLDDAFVEALNQEYDKGSWWHRFVVDQDVFLAIRENYVNAYYRGCSLLKIELKDGAIVGQIHYKYLLCPSTPNEYVKVIEDGRASLDDMESRFLKDVKDIGRLKKAVEPYAGDEKKGIQDILKANFNILDVEIAFGKDESESGAPRLDFAALQDSGDGVKVVFFEAKRFDNHKALRKQGAEKPEVVEQMETYQCKLSDHRDAVIKSYCRVCSNLRSLHGVAERNPKRHARLESVASGAAALTIDEKPVLIVFGFDGDQKVGKHWKPHRKKLQKMLKGRVHLRGNSAGFRSGISP